MRVEELAEELERFDPDAQVVVATPMGPRFVGDVGRRERPALGVHPVIYLIEGSPGAELTVADV